MNKPVGFPKIAIKGSGSFKAPIEPKELTRDSMVNDYVKWYEGGTIFTGLVERLDEECIIINCNGVRHAVSY